MFKMPAHGRKGGFLVEILMIVIVSTLRFGSRVGLRTCAMQRPRLSTWPTCVTIYASTFKNSIT
jgi:hypothetical protein